MMARFSSAAEAPVTHHRHRPHPLTVALLLGGWAVLLFGIEVMHMRPDEQLTFFNMQFTFAASMERLATANNQAPLWWMNTWAWQRLAGTTEFANRVNSTLLSVMTLAVLYTTARDWYGRRRAGWYALALAPTTAYFFIYALEMRMYPLVMLAAALSMRFFYRWTETRAWRPAVGYALSVTLLLSIHYYTAFLVIVQAAFFAVWHLRDGRLVRQGFAAAGIALLAWSPGAIIMYGQLTLIDFGEESGLRIPVEPANWETVLELAQITTNGLWALIAALLLFGVWRARPRRAYALALTWWLLGAALVMLLNIPLNVYAKRYVAWIAPGAALAVSGALTALPRRAGTLAVVGIVAAGVLGGVGPLNDICETLDNVEPRCAFGRIGISEYLKERTPYRPALQAVNHDYQPGDVLLVGADQTGFAEDQLRRYLPAEALASRAPNVSAASEAERVWYVHGHMTGQVWQDFRQIEATHRVAQVYGTCEGDRCFLAQLLEAPPERDPLVFGEALAFYGAEVGNRNDGIIPVTLWWAATEPPELDYSIAVQLIGEDGALAASADGAITSNAGEAIQTSALPTDGFTLDYRRVATPPDLPPGEYTLQVVVYQWWDGVRLTTGDGDDAAVIGTLMLP
jgi:hypothetical protein